MSYTHILTLTRPTAEDPTRGSLSLTRLREKLSSSPEHTPHTYLQIDVRSPASASMPLQARGRDTLPGLPEPCTRAHSEDVTKATAEGFSRREERLDILKVNNAGRLCNSYIYGGQAQADVRGQVDPLCSCLRVRAGTKMGRMMAISYRFACVHAGTTILSFIGRRARVDQPLMQLWEETDWQDGQRGYHATNKFKLTRLIRNADRTCVYISEAAQSLHRAMHHVSTFWARSACCRMLWRR
ncbi:hypothetical protein EDB87DRAFT_623180 [Lactarius vividus]|nr:hypothetical protein EDB87DRAFT_623180 [Lactarius vividus]